VNKQSIYIPALDGMRAIAFLLVFIAHSMPERDLPGGFGVTVFFFLSGYLITTLLRQEAENTSTISLKNFYMRRVLRIFPPCYVTVLMVAALTRLGFVYNAESYKSLAAAFLYWSNYWNILGWGNLPGGLGVLWSLAVEEHYYLVFPLLYLFLFRKFTNRKHQAAVLLALCGLALAWRCFRAGFLHSPWANIYEGTDTRFDSILFGCVLAILANPRLGDHVEWLKKHAYPLAAAGGLLIVFSFAYRNPFFRDTFRYSIQAIGLMPIFFLLILPERSWIVRWLELPVFVRLGQISYSMYLIHHTLFHHLYHFYRPTLWIPFVVLALTVAYAQAMRILIEKPLQRERQRFAVRGRPSPLAKAA
jgi:peptidoglycan/LPS O-acetylase OafA/YrhL